MTNHLLWRVTTETAVRYGELLDQLNYHSEGSPEHCAIVDQIKSLPGFPHWNNPDADLIHIELIRSS